MPYACHMYAKWLAYNRHAVATYLPHGWLSACCFVATIAQRGHPAATSADELLMNMRRRMWRMMRRRRRRMCMCSAWPEAASRCGFSEARATILISSGTGTHMSPRAHLMSLWPNETSSPSISIPTRVAFIPHIACSCRSRRRSRPTSFARDDGR